MEIWKWIDGFEGRYEISTDGRVRSSCHKKPRILKARPAGLGYDTVCIGFGNRQYIHRLVAQAFIPNPDRVCVVNHLNGIKTDNHVANLEWCDHRQNFYHAVSIGIHPNQTGLGNYNAKLSEEEVRQIRRRRETTTLSYARIGREFGVTPSTVFRIVRRTGWMHIN